MYVYIYIYSGITAFLELCRPSFFSHSAAFNYNGPCQPPSTLAGELCYSETRACSYELSMNEARLIYIDR